VSLIHTELGPGDDRGLHRVAIPIEVLGGAGDDTLFGQAGADRLEAGAGRRHLLSAGAGNDRLFAVNGRRDRVRCGRGRDRVRADARDRVAGDCETVRRARRRN
jgi:hypothetical protein